jgi:hypothetical protein
MSPNPDPTGRSFTLEELTAIVDWHERRNPGWPRIELALEYPSFPEMFGIVEDNSVQPTFFLWRTEETVVLAPFSDTPVRYSSIEEALGALTEWCYEWCTQATAKKRPKLRPSPSANNRSS